MQYSQPLTEPARASRYLARHRNQGNSCLYGAAANSFVIWKAKLRTFTTPVGRMPPQGWPTGAAIGSSRSQVLGHRGRGCSGLHRDV